MIEVEDTTLVEVTGECLEAAPVRTRAQFKIDASKAPFRADVRIHITGELFS